MIDKLATTERQDNAAQKLATALTTAIPMLTTAYAEMIIADNEAAAAGFPRKTMAIVTEKYLPAWALEHGRRQLRTMRLPDPFAENFVHTFAGSIK